MLVVYMLMLKGAAWPSSVNEPLAFSQSEIDPAGCIFFFKLFPPPMRNLSGPLPYV